MLDESANTVIVDSRVDNTISLITEKSVDIVVPAGLEIIIPSSDPAIIEVFTDLVTGSNSFNVLVSQAIEASITTSNSTAVEVFAQESTEIIIQAKGSTGIPEAPVDGYLYGRRDRAWEVILSGITANHLTLEFDFSEINVSLEIGEALPYMKVQNTILEIIEPFDNDLGITVGTDDAQAILMTITENTPSVVGQYEISNNLTPNDDDIFETFFSYANPPTEGKATITIYFN